MCIYIYIYVCMYVCMYVYVSVYLSVYVCVCVCAVCVCVGVCACLWYMYRSVCVCVCVGVCVCLWYTYRSVCGPRAAGARAGGRCFHVFISIVYKYSVYVQCICIIYMYLKQPSKSCMCRYLCRYTYISVCGPRAAGGRPKLSLYVGMCRYLQAVLAHQTPFDFNSKSFQVTCNIFQFTCTSCM